MRKLFSLGVCVTVALVEAVCFFNIWLNLDIDSNVIPYVAAISCFTLFLFTPFMLTENFIRIFLDKSTPRGKSVTVCVISLVLSLLLCLCWLGFSKIVLEIYRDDYLVAEGVDRFCFYAPYAGMVIEALALVLLFIEPGEKRRSSRKLKAPRKPKALRRKKGRKPVAEGTRTSSADAVLNTDEAVSADSTAADTADDTASPSSADNADTTLSSSAETEES